MRYIFKVNGLPGVSFNKIYKGVHWNERKKYKDQWREAFCGWHFKKDPRGVYMSTKPIRFTEAVDIAYVFRQKYLMDSTNLAFMAKLIEDSLSVDQVIQDDSPKFVRSTFLMPVQGDMKKTDSVTVIISTPDEPWLTPEEMLAVEPKD